MFDFTLFGQATLYNSRDGFCGCVFLDALSFGNKILPDDMSRQISILDDQEDYISYEYSSLLFQVRTICDNRHSWNHTHWGRNFVVQSDLILHPGFVLFGDLILVQYLSEEHKDSDL